MTVGFAFISMSEVYFRGPAPAKTRKSAAATRATFRIERVRATSIARISPRLRVSRAADATAAAVSTELTFRTSLYTFCTSLYTCRPVAPITRTFLMDIVACCFPFDKPLDQRCPVPHATSPRCAGPRTRHLELSNLLKLIVTTKRLRYSTTTFRARTRTNSIANHGCFGGWRSGRARLPTHGLHG